MPKEVHDFQLVRNITFRKGENEASGAIRIGGFEWDEEKKAWGCKCSISFLHDDTYRIFGEDPIHALELSLRSIAGLIAGAEDEGIEIWWLEPGDHCGIGWASHKEKK